MKYTILAAALLLGAAAPAAAMTIDADERELYDDSVQCMAFYGIMAGLGGDKDPEDPKAAASGTKFLAVATVLADACLVRDFRVGLALQHEVGAAAAQDHLEAVAGRPIHELRRNVLAAAGLVCVGKLGIVFKVAVGSLGVG